jgi:putative MFS transporter
MTMNQSARHYDEAQIAAIRDVAARIERMPFSSWHVKARVLIGTATFFDAFDALTIAQVLPVLKTLWSLSGPEIGLLISTGYLGQLVGALLFGAYAERWGRLLALVGAISLFAVMSLLCGFAWDYHSLLLFRTIQGLGLGGQVPIAAVYISEIAKASGRGRFVILYECIFTVGLFVSGWVGSYVVPNFGWQAMFFIGAAPILVALSLRWALPESPRWLAARNRIEDAKRAVARIEAEVEKATGRKLEPPSERVYADSRRASWRDILGPEYLKRSLVIWLIWFATFLVTYSLSTWLPTLYRTVFNLPLETSLRLATFGTFMQLVGGITAGLTVDRIGRRWLFTVAFFGAGSALVFVWFLGLGSAMWFFICSGIAYYFAGLSVLGAYLYTPEIYPTRARAFGTSLGTAWLRLASMVGPLIVGYFLASGIGAVFLIFAAVAFLAGIVVVLFAVETSGKPLEEISH